ncbi:RNA-binding protein [Mycoplasma sp. NEAQ87857]|uniref:RNA-binding protein n=1 Tax=Mycoplasma sp. NEAQ87857 TaxID=2683967 RepID=UPI001318ED14|nr:RNA-binding protein [Mycoplasma sp. NEAQ87857]QGZ97844.1 RNA-binding protein [Mycoplasma sp. NEAQ87857]
MNIKYKPNDVLNGRVKTIGSKYIKVELKNGAVFCITKNEITDFQKTKINQIINVNDHISFVVINFNPKYNMGNGSFKRNHPNYRRNPFNYGIKETKNGFKNLFEHTIHTLKES